MNLLCLNKRSDIEGIPGLKHFYQKLEQLIKVLQNKALPPDVVSEINSLTEKVNALPDGNNRLKDVVRDTYWVIVKIVERKCKIVPKNHYRNLWMAVGMVIFGLSIGLVFDLANGHAGMLAIGLPIGLVIGMSYGSAKDKNAFEEGRQIDVTSNKTN